MNSEIPDSLKSILENSIDENFEPKNTLTKKQVVIATHFIQHAWYDLCKQRQRFENDKRQFQYRKSHNEGTMNE